MNATATARKGRKGQQTAPQTAEPAPADPNVNAGQNAAPDASQASNAAPAEPTAPAPEPAPVQPEPNRPEPTTEPAPAPASNAAPVSLETQAMGLLATIVSMLAAAERGLLHAKLRAGELLHTLISVRMKMGEKRDKARSWAELRIADQLSVGEINSTHYLKGYWVARLLCPKGFWESVLAGTAGYLPWEGFRKLAKFVQLTDKKNPECHEYEIAKEVQFGENGKAKTFPVTDELRNGMLAIVDEWVNTSDSGLRKDSTLQNRLEVLFGYVAAPKPAEPTAPASNAAPAGDNGIQLPTASNPAPAATDSNAAPASNPAPEPNAAPTAPEGTTGTTTEPTAPASNPTAPDATDSKPAPAPEPNQKDSAGANPLTDKGNQLAPIDVVEQVFQLVGKSTNVKGTLQTFAKRLSGDKFLFDNFAVSLVEEMTDQQRSQLAEMIGRENVKRKANARR